MAITLLLYNLKLGFLIFTINLHSSLIFTRESSYCLQRVLAISIMPARLSVCPFVRLSVTRVDQPKTVQARIIKSSPSAAWKALVLETVKLFHKFEGGHSERGR